MDYQLFWPTMPVLIARVRRTLAGRLRESVMACSFNAAGTLLFEVKDGAECDVDFHELAWA